jgi:hypothetical protein
MKAIATPRQATLGMKAEERISAILPPRPGNG